MGYPADWIERQLAHTEQNSVRRAYNHADYLADRAKMMQQWADTTELLRHLAAAANKFWKLYDPSDVTTAPKKEDVIGWLMKERGVLQRPAESIATILRADGLPPGPRKK